MIIYITRTKRICSIQNVVKGEKKWDFSLENLQRK